MKTLIKRAMIYDGGGEAPYVGDVLIDGTKIAAVGANLTPDGAAVADATVADATVADATVVDAAGLALAPGFINTHDHMDTLLFADPHLERLLQQGVTTTLSGQCGSSIAPVDSDEAEALICSPFVKKTYADNAKDRSVPFTTPWRTYKAYLDAVAAAKPDVRCEFLVGHAALRRCAMGEADKEATEGELAHMERLLDSAMQDGAKGLSYGLLYPPSSFAPFSELVALARIVRKYDGILMIHMRNDNDDILASMQENFDIVRQSGVRLQVSHLKVCGERNWDKTEEVLASFDRMREDGYAVTFDQYPYTASCTNLGVMLPGWAFDGGQAGFLRATKDPETLRRIRAGIESQLVRRATADQIVMVSVVTEKWNWIVGKSIREIAEEMGVSAVDAILAIVTDEGTDAQSVYHMMCEASVERIMQHPCYTLGTDGAYLNHPRAYGSYQRFLGHYVRDRKVLSLPDAIRHITSIPAARLRLPDRGRIAVGLSADLVLFNPDTVIDRATYVDYDKSGVGIEKVWVLGALKYEAPENE